jgi:sorbitol-specific phosphotransferase system component IIBC
MKLTDQEVKDFFINCNSTDRNGIYHGEGNDALDIREFANKIAEYVALNSYARGRREEHKRLVKIAKEVNKDVASLLESKREYAND